MRQLIHLVQVSSYGPLAPASVDGMDWYNMLRDLAGYVIQAPSAAPQLGTIKAWSMMVVTTGPVEEANEDFAPTIPPPLLNGVQQRLVDLRAVGRLIPVAAPPTSLRGPLTLAAPQTPAIIRNRRPVRSAQAYRITTPAAQGLVRPELAEALETVFERFAREHGFTIENPLEIRLSRGFKAGSPGHDEGRAADIAAVSGKSLLEWNQEWDRAMAAAEKLSDSQQRAKAVKSERKRNLGYGLYKALQEHGGWRVNNGGWRPYRGVMQLYGPWTATEGPWQAMQIQEPNPYQRRRLADQQWVFRAHQDHIHVAR